MTINEYMEKVINLFKSGKATDAQYKEMSKCVLNQSESDGNEVEQIDKDILEANHNQTWGEVKNILCDKWDSCSPCPYSGAPSRTHGGLECNHPLNPHNAKAENSDGAAGPILNPRQKVVLLYLYFKEEFAKLSDEDKVLYLSSFITAIKQQKSSKESAKKGD